MSYRVKEIFYTLQGEGAHAGRPAVFCRFTGCNLWTGREQHRASAVCQFCDTDFVGTDGPGGGRFATAEDSGRCGRERVARGAAPAQPSPTSCARAANRCSNWTQTLSRRCTTTGFARGGRDQRHPTGPARARLDLRQPESRRRDWS